MNCLNAGTLVFAFALCGAAEAGPHALTYTQISVAPGTPVSINNEPYVAVQFPLREFGTDNRYAVRHLARKDAEGSGFGWRDVVIRHSVEPLKNPNATIDGFPAEIEVVDERIVLLGDGVDPNKGEMAINSYIRVIVRIQVGDALVIIDEMTSRNDQSVELDLRYSGTSQAVYSRYKDHVDLIGPNGLDKWVDYIRVIPLQ